MSSIAYECAFGEKSVAATLGALDPQHREWLRAMVEQVRLSGFFDRHPDFLSRYEGLSIVTWPKTDDDAECCIEFSFTFTNEPQRLSLVIGTTVYGEEKTVHVYLLDRSGSTTDYGTRHFLDVSTICQQADTDFTDTIDRSQPVHEEFQRVVSHLLSKLEDDLTPFLSGTLKLAETDFRHTTIHEIEQIVEALNDVNCRDAVGDTLLCHATKAARLDQVEFLLQAGASPNGVPLQNTVNLAATQSTIISLLELLARASVDPNDVSDPPGHVTSYCERQSPLGASARRGHIDVVRWLLRHGAQGLKGETFSDCSPAIRQIIGSCLGRFRTPSQFESESLRRQEP
jgi:Ankyrin repeat